MAESPYTLGQRCLAEFVGMIFVIYVGEAALANELLPNTKGHAMGWGWTVFSFGMTFMVPLQVFGQVSAKLNPAMCLAQWIMGSLNGVDFICLSLSEVAGAFVGAILLWLHFYPHFKTLPEPPPDDREDELLRRRDYMGTNAMNIASYNTRKDRKVGPTKPRKFLDDFAYYARADDNQRELEVLKASDVLDEYLHAHDPGTHAMDQLQANCYMEAGTRKHNNMPELRRRSVQVADLQAHLQHLHIQNVVRRRQCPTCVTDDGAPGAKQDQGAAAADAAAPEAPRAHSTPDMAAAKDVVPPGHEGAAAAATGAQPDSPSKLKASSAAAAGAKPAAARHHHSLHMFMHPYRAAQGDGVAKAAAKVMAAQSQRTSRLYQAAMEADRNAKLSIFATRPAINSPFWNFYCEAAGTVFLLLMALLIELTPRLLPLPADPVAGADVGMNLQLGFKIYVQALLIAFGIVICIAGMGGPTAYAANPARDFGPRMAHFLLPIPNKGPSEWVYAWIPFFAPLVGGVIAGFLYYALEEILCPGGGVKGPAVCGPGAPRLP